MDKESIWKTAEQCWNEAPNASIGWAFVQYWRNMKMVVKEKGSNAFLGRNGSNNLHSKIREQFDETEKGVKPSFRHPSKKNG